MKSVSPFYLSCSEVCLALINNENIGNCLPASILEKGILVFAYYPC